jgi:hypothetical protein
LKNQNFVTLETVNNKLLVGGLAISFVVIAIGSTIWLLRLNNRLTPIPDTQENVGIRISTSTISPVVTGPDLPPLYPGVKWGEVEERKGIVFRSQENELIELDGHHVESTKLINYPSELLNYYQQEFNQLGWVKSWVADGPGSESYGYENKGQYFQLSVQAASPSGYRVFIEFN